MLTGKNKWSNVTLLESDVVHNIALFVFISVEKTPTSASGE